MKKKKHNSVDGFVPRRYQTSSLDDHLREDAQTTLGHTHQHGADADEELHSGVSSTVRPDAPSGVKEDIGESLRAIDSDVKEEKQAKLALVYAAKQTIANGLALLGIAAPERM